MAKVELINGNSIEVIKSFDQIDTIITDPPSWSIEYKKYTEKAKVVVFVTGEKFLEVERTHPGQKQVQIYIDIIEAVRKNHSGIKTIVDPYMGSGTIGIAAIRCGIDYIGIEKNKKWFRMAQVRLNREQETQS